MKILLTGPTGVSWAVLRCPGWSKTLPTTSPGSSNSRSPSPTATEGRPGWTRTRRQNLAGTCSTRPPTPKPMWTVSARPAAPVVTLRLSRLYGPGKASGDFVAGVANRKAPIVGAGDNYVSSIHVGGVHRHPGQPARRPQATEDPASGCPSGRRQGADAAHLLTTGLKPTIPQGDGLGSRPSRLCTRDGAMWSMPE